ncbi:MAG: hypothetical protein ABJA67_11675 [Chthonomonadales bacterium]
MPNKADRLRANAPTLRQMVDGAIGHGGSNTDLTANPAANIEIGFYTLTPKGLIGGKGATQDEWKALGKFLARLEGSIQWLIGDWFLQAEREWGKTYEGADLETGYSKATLKDYAYVARGVELSVRTDQLTFGHHKLLVGMPQDRQVYWIGVAINEGMSISQLRSAIDGAALPVQLEFKFSDEVLEWESIFAKKVVRLRNAIGKKQHLSPDEVRQDAQDIIVFAQRLLQELDNQ